MKYEVLKDMILIARSLDMPSPLAEVIACTELQISGYRGIFIERLHSVHRQNFNLKPLTSNCKKLSTASLKIIPAAH